MKNKKVIDLRWWLAEALEKVYGPRFLENRWTQGLPYESIPSLIELYRIMKRKQKLKGAMKG